MHIGAHLGYWQAGPPAGMAQTVMEFDDLGLDSVWTAEAYGSDALTPLAWWGAQTRRLRLGTAVAQLSARTPTATAMAALTLDHLSSGRFVLGLGVSGPQVVEGWYGASYERPLARTREYVEIVRQVLRREAPVTSPGPHYPLPVGSPRGMGKPLRATVHPLRADLPIHLAAQGPRNIALAAEIADGWLPLFYAPRLDADFRAMMAPGFARRSSRLRAAHEFEVAATVPVVVDADVERAADRVRPFVALYAAGMGAPGANFHRNALDRLGYRDALDEIAAHYRAGRRDRAAAAVPTALIEEIALVGPPSKIARDLQAWRACAVTTVLVQGDPLAVRTVWETTRPGAGPLAADRG